MSFSFLVFDLDGTLIDSAPDLARAVNRVLAEYSRPQLEEAQIKEMIGDGAAQLLRRAFAASHSQPLDFTAVLNRFFAIYSADPTAHTVLYPGVQQTIAALAGRGLRLAVCTNKPIGPATEILRRLGIAEYFERVVGGDTWPFRKPDPRMLTDLIGAANTTRDQTLMIGDSEVDAATAQAADVAFALVSYGYLRGSPQSVPKLAYFEHFDAVLEYVV